MYARIMVLTGLAIVLTLIYPFEIILAWYFSTMFFEIWNIQIQKQVIHAHAENETIHSRHRVHLFAVSWAESLCMVALFIALSVGEGQIPHFIPYIILLCTSLYVATSTFQSAVLMFSHLAFYNLAFLFVSGRDVMISYPDTSSILWTQFLTTVLIVFFLTDSYLFFQKIHLERRAKSQEVDEARKCAEALAAQKSDLISAIGHELRTPLNGILGFSQMIQRTELSSKQQKYINLIEGAGKDLHLLLSNILDSETLEQGFFHVDPVKTDVTELLDRTLKLFEADAAEKNIYLKLEIGDNFPNVILIDEIRLGQCVSNLLSNAVRFTQTGGVTIKANYIENPDTALAISVTDTGTGIPKDQTEVIFEKFAQAKDPKIIQSGTGIGLWLTRSIAVAMDGNLTLVNTSSLGSRFQLDFNLNQQITENTNASNLRDYRILHIEDIPTNLMLIRILLEEQGAIITEAKTAKQAMETLTTAEFDAILCDLQLPDRDGNHLVDDIRKLENVNANIPIIALTAQPEKVKKSSDFITILSKPVDHQLLISTLEQLS